MQLNNIEFTFHSRQRFCLRTYCNPVDSVNKMQKILIESHEISKEEAFDLTGDPVILNKKNKMTKYYAKKLDDSECIINNTIAIFVIKNNKCITVKTNKEKMIYAQA